MDKNLEYLLNEFKDRMTMLQEAVHRGGCTNFEEYKYTCGQLRGLEAACLIVADLNKRLEHSDD